MAERRMFAKSIVLSDAFLDLPMSARCLYFTLGMLADDDGFVNAPRSIMRQCGASDDDMKILLAKKFALVFESGVIVIKHWRINNYLRNDRYTETKYIEEKSLLSVEENGAYHKEEFPVEEPKSLTAKELRKKAYEESDLPYSFEYKIRSFFHGRICPVCGQKMLNHEHSMSRPSIQHNIPISKGGKHDLSNISVICHNCNVRLQDTPTGDLNNADVVEAWAEISGIPKDGIPSKGKDSKGKDSKGKVSLDKDIEAGKPPKRAAKRFTPPTLEEVRAYCRERNSSVNPDDFYNYFTADPDRQWIDAKGHQVTSWKQKILTWEKYDTKPKKAGDDLRESYDMMKGWANE